MIDNNFAILQFDKEKDAFLNPQDMNSEKKKINKNCILCFFDNVLKELEDSKEITVVETLNSPLGSHKIYELKYKDTLINLFNPGLGGPMAAGFLEELISLGSENFIACGGAGVLVSSIEMGQLIVPTTAIRDEGTSYHYILPEEEVNVKDHVLKLIEKVLTENNINYLKGKTWTTDAIYRETKNKIEKRKQEGCITVEMEFASMLAVSMFRNVNFGQLLYGGDNLDGTIWEYRDWRENESVQSKMLWLCADILVEMNKNNKKDEM